MIQDGRSNTPKMEAIRSSKVSITIYPTSCNKVLEEIVSNSLENYTKGKR
jgi:hypothetical protein